jgi:hypothetical protein
MNFNNLFSICGMFINQNNAYLGCMIINTTNTNNPSLPCRQSLPRRATDATLPALVRQKFYSQAFAPRAEPSITNPIRNRPDQGPWA